MEFEEDLGEMIYMVDLDKRMSVRGTPEEEDTPQKPQMVGIFTSQRTVEGVKCGCQELM